MNLMQQGILVEKPRISSIDLVRGLVMVVMALDHVRHFFHDSALLYEPTELGKTTPILFFTRWITHFCAPAFVLLAGVAIRISSRRKSKKDLRGFLITRGLWLIFLELIIIRFSFFFNWYFDLIVFQVIWVIGAAMILMAVLIHLRDYALLALAIVILAGHNLLDGLIVEPTSPLYPAYTCLFRSGYITLTAQSGIQVMYPLIPWLGIMLLGYFLGRWYSKEYDVLRTSYLLIAGLVMLLLFVVLRYINTYGDPSPWKVHHDMTFTVLSFLNCEKYPPSLLFTCMTLAPLLILLSILEKVSIRFLNPLVVFGRVPLFYYILHFYLIHIAALWLFLLRTGRSLGDVDFHISESFGGIEPGSGYSLSVVYVAWLATVLILYPVSLWYSTFKSRQTRWWMSYV
jgi:uncharacterized membrane protein